MWLCELESSLLQRFLLQLMWGCVTRCLATQTYLSVCHGHAFGNSWPGHTLLVPSQHCKVTFNGPTWWADWSCVTLSERSLHLMQACSLLWLRELLDSDCSPRAESPSSHAPQSAWCRSSLLAYEEHAWIFLSSESCRDKLADWLCAQSSLRN